MQCRQAEARVQALLDARAPLESDGTLQRHLASCDECRERAEAFRLVARTFSPRGRVRFAVGNRGASVQRRWARLPAPAALAAAIAGLAFWLMQGGVRQERPQVVALALHQSAGQPAAGDRDFADLAATDANLAGMGTLAWLTANSVNATLMNVGPIPSSTRLWMEPVSDGFRPLARSMEAALGAMRATVLGPDPGTRS
jgi:hypothetical protein